MAAPRTRRHRTWRSWVAQLSTYTILLIAGIVNGDDIGVRESPGTFSFPEKLLLQFTDFLFFKFIGKAEGGEHALALVESEMGTSGRGAALTAGGAVAGGAAGADRRGWAVQFNAGVP